jgi:hypothetical protein
MNGKPTEIELHQELQRFTTQLVDRVTQATDVLERESGPGVRDEALKKNLLYVSSALEIATGPFAVANLLDMLVFLRLCESVLVRHYLPSIYGERGRPLVEVFSRAEEELDVLALRALAPGQRDELDALVSQWLEENPAQVRVEGIRLADFADVMGTAVVDRARKARGLLASVMTATRTADHALLLSERSLFLVHRLPFVWRLQARLGAREVLDDALAQLTERAEGPTRKLASVAGRVARGGAVGLGVLVAAALLFGLLTAAGGP